MAGTKHFNKETFVRVYAMTGNGTKAAIAAGSTENSAATTAWRMLRNVDILSRVRAKQDELAEQACLTENYVLLQLKDIYEKCSVGKPVLEWDYDNHKMVETGEYTFDSKGALKAMEMIGNYLGMFKDNVTLSGAAPVRIVDDMGDGDSDS